LEKLLGHRLSEAFGDGLVGVFLLELLVDALVEFLDFLDVVLVLGPLVEREVVLLGDQVEVVEHHLLDVLVKQFDLASFLLENLLVLLVKLLDLSLHYLGRLLVVGGLLLELLSLLDEDDALLEVGFGDHFLAVLLILVDDGVHFDEEIFSQQAVLFRGVDPEVLAQLTLQLF